MNGVAAVGGGGGGGRVSTSIPSHVRRTIHDIREITGKQHSDDEIYAVLKECSMDPDETAQKLLYLDTFHEVKRRRDRRKENLSNRKSEGSRFMQGRLARGGQDYSGGRNVAAREDNGVSHNTERGRSMPSAFSVAQKTGKNAAPLLKKASTVIPNGPRSLSDGNSHNGISSHSSVGGLTNVPKDSSAVDVNKLRGAQPKYAAVAAISPTGPAEVVKQAKSTSDSDQLSPSATPVTVSSACSSVLDPVLTPALSQHPSAVYATEHVGSQRLAAEPNHLQGKKYVPQDVSDLELPKNEKTASRDVSSIHEKESSEKSTAVQTNIVSQSFLPSSVSDNSLAISSSSDSASRSTQESDVPKGVISSKVATTIVEVISPSPNELNVNFRPRVTFPNHFWVSEALKNGLTFGNFDSNTGLNMESVGGIGGGNNSSSAVESSQGIYEIAKEPSSNQIVSSNAHDNFPDHEESLPQPVLEKVNPSESNVACAGSKDDELKQEISSPPEGPNPTVQNAPNYNLGLASTMLGSQLVHFEGSESQAQETSRYSNLSANSPALSSRTPTPPLQSSVIPQSVPVLRQPYPPNFIPYGHYYHPFYMPHLHQYLSHIGFPQQPSTANVYLTPAPAAHAGVKSSLPQLKPEANAGNPNHIGLSFGGSFLPPPVGYSPGSAVTSGSSAGIEDLATSQLKENHIYTTGPLSEVPAVWIPSQDISSLPVNSSYNFSPHGQHMSFSPAQASHGAFTGIYAGQTLTASSTLLQQSQALAGAVETGGPPSGVFQQPQHAQMNWISNF
ncbi:hypothetical protein F2P56_021039 [Juglans regia]|uniref:GBF-interacting protein 1-like isoform X1 n=2 Tax=Juglans regia TaxID=51240 RepID=A0A2I4F1W0_JUGRE|nr:GBF-interacting protein 1-like isoform X1 [Juglans regia]KAF5461222.1 hypothetical protein F2P56_021039 [Juglans regia]